MFSRLRLRKTARALASIGSQVDEQYLVYLNNDEPVSFKTRSDALNYVAQYRFDNEIFHLQIYRINTYSL